MAQTTGALAQSGFKIEVSADGSSWVDVSGSVATVTVDGGDVSVAVQHTAEGDEAIVVSSGKQEPRTITCKAVYTENATESFVKVWTAYDSADKRIYVRWSPAGGATGEFRYVAAVAGAAALVPIVSCTLPELDASGEDVALFEFSVMAPGILKETIGT